MLGQYIPRRPFRSWRILMLAPYPGSDYYEIALVEIFASRCTPQLPATKLQGYVQMEHRDTLHRRTNIHRLRECACSRQPILLY